MKLIFDSIDSMCKNGRFKETAGYIQHGETTCLRHTVAVAYYSDRIVRRFHIPCSRRELIRGALLHDYFLYDWHKKGVRDGLHGFTHPKTALKNACMDFELTDTEKNIIARHMFPLTVIPPATVESWIVCIVDKACSIYEVFSRSPYGAMVAALRKNNVGIDC